MTFLYELCQILPIHLYTIIITVNPWAINVMLFVKTDINTAPCILIHSGSNLVRLLFRF